MLLILVLPACGVRSSDLSLATSTATVTPESITPTATIEPSPSPTPRPAVPPATDEDWSLGSREASVTLIEYCDFQEPTCASTAPILAQLLEMHPEELLLIYRQFPLLGIYDKSSLAGQAAEAAGAQGAFWPMHDLLFERHQEWIELDPDAFLSWLETAATEIGLDQADFTRNLAEGRYVDKMEVAFQQGLEAGIVRTPALFFNQAAFYLNPGLANLEAGFRLARLERRQYPSYPPLLLNPGTEYFARILTTQGEIVVRLLPDSAPLAVNNFVFLSREGWFDQNIFYRVVPNLLVETGDPSGTGFGGPGYHFQTELDPDLTFDQPGMLAMSSSGPSTNASIFFINLSPQSQLNRTRTIFGTVIEGLELLRGLEARDPLQDLLLPAELEIRSIMIEEH